MGFNCTKLSNENRTTKYWSEVKTKKNKVVELGLRFPKWYGTLKSDQKCGSYSKTKISKNFQGKN
jgi:hypothetical protein